MPAPPPPGPRAPALLQALRIGLDPVGYLSSLRDRYGPAFTVRYPGFAPEVYVTTAELAEKVYALDAGGGRAGEVRRAFLEPVVGPHSLLNLDGAPWMRHRKLLSPPLRGRAVSGYRGEITRIAADAMDGWPTGEPVTLLDLMQQITLEVIMRLVFGIRDLRRRDRLRMLLPKLLRTGSARLAALSPRLRDRMMRSSPLRRVPSLPTTRLAVLREAVDAILYDEIARRRAEPDPDAEDVLSRLLAARDGEGRPMSDQEIRDELLTMLEAGHETTATALAWTFERLAREPRVLRTLRAELEAGEERYLDAVIKEALRARPVVYEAPRLLDAPLRLGGHEVPAGWSVAPLIALVHRDPAVFPDPEEFRPERFLGEGAARAQKSWMPFGGGRRYCVGAQLALLEMRVIIREALARFDPVAPDPAPEASRFTLVTLAPARRARLVLRPRAAAPVPAGRMIVVVRPGEPGGPRRATEPAGSQSSSSSSHSLSASRQALLRSAAVCSASAAASRVS